MNNTTNTLLQLGTEDLEQVLSARKTIENVARKVSFVSRVSPHQVVHRRSPNGSDGHNGHKPKMPQRIREKIAVGMKRRWAQRRREAKKSEAAAPA